MDFSTRDRYRHAIEELARGSGRSELDVAREAVLLATRTGLGAGRADDPHDARRDDPGYYLIADGRTALELAIGFRPPATRRVFRAYVASATAGYLGTIIVLSGLTLALPLLTVGASGTMPASLILLGLLAAVPASDLVIALLNRWVPVLLPPRELPRLELRDGVPSSLRTMIVVPTLLTDRTEVAELIERLEVHYLANPDGDVRFALLSDWTDAPTESGPGDEETLAAAREGIGRLNSHYGDALEGGQRFLLFHRRRLWNESEQTWMGWERKRGKLHELNRLLRGVTDTSFLSAGGAAPVAPPDVRYVITLDADTRLPRGAVNRLVGTMAHPLNGPRFDPGTGRVVEGYAVLQPRVTPPLPGGESSFFQRLSSGPSGIDPYAAAVSDVYQGLFGEGSYTGKGIYDVDAFEAALAGRVPENALLSHDLFEGVFARAGLVTDIELFERAPSHYGVAAARQHRWARGDWQLLPWIVGYGSHLPIPLIGRWLMSDAIVRTLVRVYVTHCKLLEWVTAAQAKAGLRLDLGGFYRRMGGGVTLAVAAAAVVAWGRAEAWSVALPLLLLWAASPAVARWISLPRLTARTTPLSSGDARALRLIARRTWRFFAAFVRPHERAPPPHNFQGEPDPVAGPPTPPTDPPLD